MRVIRCCAVAALAMILAAAPSSPVRADGSARGMIARLNADGDDRLYMLLFIAGMLNGFVWANAHVERRLGLPPLYCTPPRLTLTAEQAADILRRYVQRNPEFATQLAGFAMMEALRDTFPCPSPAPPTSPQSPRR